MKKIKSAKSFAKLSILASTLLLGSIAVAVPTSIEFTNNTSLSLATAIGNFPGNGIEANVSRSVHYSIITLGCYSQGLQNDCPIEFTDRETGEKVATIRMNAETGTLLSAPTFYGKYANDYTVTGWDATPISHITINEK